MLRVGLTGGLGSGKSTVAKIFETLDVPVYYADEAARRLMNEDEQVKKQVIKNFGAESYYNGLLNRSFLAAVVFRDQEKIDILNAIVHPATIADAEKWMNSQTFPYAIKEAALIFESDAWKLLDYIIGVSAPHTLRLSRAMQRDGLSADAVEQRMKRQMDVTEKMQRCNIVLNNDEKVLLLPQVLHVHDKLLLRAGVE